MSLAVWASKVPAIADVKGFRRGALQVCDGRTASRREPPRLRRTNPEAKEVREGIPMIGRLERVPLGEVWKHEATDFTRPLEENMHGLSETLDLDLPSGEREQAAG